MQTALHEDIDTKARRFLGELDADWQRLVTLAGPCTIQRREQREPYEALIRAVAHQQLHGNAAAAILARLMASFPHTGFPSAQQLAAADETALRSCGLSMAKVAAVRGIAEATLAGTVPSAAVAAGMSDEELITRLTSLKGIGRWTVEMLLIFTLGRNDVLPVDDFGVREGWRLLKNLSEQPKPKALAVIGEQWKPYRSIAAWYLWQAAALGKSGALMRAKEQAE
jgi:DNA-3-methyladenine glycosylase II